MGRQYKIYNSKGNILVNAESPKQAIISLYNNYDVKIESTIKEKANHIVELINSSRKNVSYYNVSINKLDRKPKPVGYIEPMPKKLLHKLIREFKEIGGIVIINDELDVYLKKQKAEGTTLNGNTIILCKNPSKSAVYEELFHAQQYREGKNDGSKESRLLCEIEAQEYLIENKIKLGITDIEDKQTRLALKSYIKQYNNLINTLRR